MEMEMTKQSKGEDRLSALPDAIINEILSLLPFESVIATSILSRQWQHLSFQISSFTFYNPHFTTYKDLCRFWFTFNTFSSKLTFPLSRSFTLHLDDTFFIPHRPSFTDLWFRQICGSSMNKLQVTSNFCRLGYDFVAPSHCVFQMQSLKVLELGGCFAWSLTSNTTSIHLPNLNKLSIHVVCHQFKLLEKLISSIPSLEDLSFWVNCDGYHNWHKDDPLVDHVTLLSPNLKKLYAKVYSKKAVIIINAPLLQYLKVASYRKSRFYFLQKPALLVEAATWVSHWSCTCCDGTLVDVLEAVSNVKRLMIKGATGELIYPNLTILAYRMSSWVGISILLLLLNNCPVLEVLKLDLSFYFSHIPDNRLTPSNFMPASMLTHVKIIELKFLYFPRPTRLIKRLIRSACVLEQFHINFTGEHCFWTAKMWHHMSLKFFVRLVECQEKLLHCHIEYSGFGLKLSCDGSRLIEELSSRATSLC